MQTSVGGQFAQLSKSGTTVTWAGGGDLSDLLTLTLASDGIPSSVVSEAHRSVEENTITQQTAEQSGGGGGFPTVLSQRSWKTLTLLGFPVFACERLEVNHHLTGRTE